MDYVTSLVYEYGMLAMFLLILLEYACFPVSSEIVLPFSGAIASLQHISFFLVLPLSILAGLIGTSICYFIGHYGGAPLLTKLKTKFPSTKAGIDKSYSQFTKYGSITVCIGRVIPICRTYVAFIAGAVKQNYAVFLSSSAIGITVWNTLLIGIGYFLRENWSTTSQYYDKFKLILLPLLLFIAIILLYRHFHAKKNCS